MRRKLPPRVFRQLGTKLERVLQRRVVKNGRARMKAGNRPGDEIPLRRVKIAARRIDPEGPTSGPGLLPRGERECIVEEPRDGDTVQRGWSDETERERGRVARFRSDCEEIQRQHRRAIEPAERIRLRVPVHVPESGRKQKRTVLRSLMVRERDVQR